MKLSPALSAAALLALPACQNSNSPMGSGTFDPLTPPGSQLQLDSANNAPTFRPGQFVTAATDNTAFYKNRPKGNADADKLLRRGTSMKIVQKDASYLRVELDDSGEVGWVPSVMVLDPNAPPAGLQPAPGEFQVYPPGQGNFDPIPLPDPGGFPPDTAIPQIIDPTAPIPIDPTGLPPIQPVEVPVVPVVPVIPTPPPIPAPELQDPETPAEGQ